MLPGNPVPGRVACASRDSTRSGWHRRRPARSAQGRPRLIVRLSAAGVSARRCDGGPGRPGGRNRRGSTIRYWHGTWVGGSRNRTFRATRRRAGQIREADRESGRPLICHPEVALRAFSGCVDLLMVGQSPLATSLEMVDYATWIRERTRLARPGTIVWSRRLRDVPPEAPFQRLAYRPHNAANRGSTPIGHHAHLRPRFRRRRGWRPGRCSPDRTSRRVPARRASRRSGPRSSRCGTGARRPTAETERLVRTVRPGRGARRRRAGRTCRRATETPGPGRATGEQRIGGRRRGSSISYQPISFTAVGIHLRAKRLGQSCEPRQMPKTGSSRRRPGGSSGPRGQERIRVDLVHVHRPAEHDQPGRTVSYEPLGHAVEQVDVSPNPDRRREQVLDSAERFVAELAQYEDVAHRVLPSRGVSWSLCDRAAEYETTAVVRNSVAPAGPGVHREERP